METVMSYSQDAEGRTAMAQVKENAALAA